MNVVNMSQKDTLKWLRISYITWTVIAMYSLLYIPAKFINFENAAATIANISSNTTIYFTGIAGSIITQIFQVIVALLLYQFFKNVDKTHATLVVIFGLLGAPIAMLNEVFKIGAAFTTNPELVSVLLEMNHYGVLIAGIFWGLWLFPLGYLIYKSGYFPKWLGTVVVIAGFGYLIGNLVHFIYPSDTIYSIFEALTFGELIWVLYIVFLGAKLKK